MVQKVSHLSSWPSNFSSLCNR